MKIKILTLLLGSVTFCSTAYAQFSFGVSPGLGLNTVYFGYKANEKLVPFVGFQYVNVNFNNTQSGEEYDINGQLISYSDETEFKGSLYIPNLGAKYFFTEMNSLKAYGSLSLSKPIIGGKISINGEEDEDFKETLKNYSLWGGELGFGVEYFFDDNFSLGGEFGLRYMHLNYEETSQTTIFNPNTGDITESEVKNEFNLNLSPTYSKVSLNYYF